MLDAFLGPVSSRSKLAEIEPLLKINRCAMFCLG